MTTETIRMPSPLASNIIGAASKNPNYRPDIDGLRALAIVPVVLFHAGVSLFSGGFVGVDIFFVISGYLITSLLLQDFLSGRFSISQFYVRRVRRIFPALAVTILVSLLVGFFVLLPHELAAAGQAAKGIAYFSSNHIFRNTQNDYWLQNSLSNQPLLHTWSLAVEEQFYVVLPCLLAVYFWRRSKNSHAHLNSLSLKSLQPILFILALLSFGSCIWMLQRDSATAFYLLPFRAWELLVGSLLAVHLTADNARPKSIAACELGSMLGILMILCSVFIYTEETPFPGIYALLPCIGAALIIFFGSGPNKPFINKLLSTAPFVSIGLISYSMYLWHWPILVLAKSVGWHAWGLPSLSLPQLLIITSFFSFVSWRWIEQPFRHSRTRSVFNGKELGFGLLILGILFVLGLFAQRIGEHGAPLRQPQPAVLVKLGQDLKAAPGERCEGNPDIGTVRKSGGGCNLGRNASSNSVPAFAIVGDSHARMWTPALDRLASDANTFGLGLTYSSCTPLLGYIPPTRKECAEIMQAAISYVATSPVKNVILAGYWLDAMKSMEKPGNSNDANLEEFSNGFENTLKILSTSGKNIYIVLDVPELQNDLIPREKTIESIRYGGQAAYGLSLNTYRKQQAENLQVFVALQRKYGFQLIDPAAQICKTDECLVAANGRTFYRDKHHLTDDAAIAFRDVFPRSLYGLKSSSQ